MTHAELLAVLNDVITDDVHHVATQTAQALRAVVELHHPQGEYCWECSFPLDSVYVPYPCPTIQKIEEEMEK